MAINYKVSELKNVACKNLQATLLVLSSKIGTTIAKISFCHKSSISMINVKTDVSCWIPIRCNQKYDIFSQNGLKKHNPVDLLPIF